MNKAIDISNVILKTARLTLRPFQETDLDDFYAYAKVDGVGQWAGWLPHKSKEDTQVILNLFIKGKKTFAIVYEGRVVGSIGIERYNEKELPEFKDQQGREIGYVLAKDLWGNGLMSEAVKAVVNWLFVQEHLDFIVCGNFSDNHRSRRVWEKCGFKYYKNGSYMTKYGQEKATMISILINDNKS
ncbi:MAG: GNAT family N-acetyltransferase [Erysipelotrichaceae bacterium]|nr:GNAT family N-acetyltransferase [Erysipelotrichaceae bacterium]